VARHEPLRELFPGVAAAHALQCVGADAAIEAIEVAVSLLGAAILAVALCDVLHLLVHLLLRLLELAWVARELVEVLHLGHDLRHLRRGVLALASDKLVAQPRVGATVDAEGRQRRGELGRARGEALLGVFF